MPAGGLTIDPKAERALRRVLPPDEEILWAVAQRSPSWRQWYFFLMFGIFFCAFALPVSPWSRVTPISQILAVSSVWYFVGEWSYVFACTSRRVIILRTLPPRSWTYIDYGKMDADWGRSHSGLGVIKFGGQVFQHFTPSGKWSHFTSQRLGMKGYIDNVPDIEAVRALILEQIAMSSNSARP
ncbi:MAG: hypothetical protein Q8R02_16625 [Hyphomonadaceae bacterium]|nr:hypothetical protein [Hyphomonadaceae bacterium]